MRSMGFIPPITIPDFSRISGLMNLPAGYLANQFLIGQNAGSIADAVGDAVSSGYNALENFIDDDFLNGVGEFVRNGLDGLGDWFSGLTDMLGEADKPSGSPGQPSFDYLNAELAKFYGMDRNTAYQEALANTAYQRAVSDMQRAGLNPAALFGAGRGSTASGVAYISSGSSSSGSAKDSKLFSSEDFGLIASLAGLATAVATKKPSNFWLGQQGAQAVMQVLNGLDRKFG